MKNGFFALILLSIFVLGCTVLPNSTETVTNLTNSTQLTNFTQSVNSVYSIEGIWETPDQTVNGLGVNGRYVQTIYSVSDSLWESRLNYLSSILINDYGFKVGDIELRNLVQQESNSNVYTGEALYRYPDDQAPTWMSGTLTVGENTAEWSVPGRDVEVWNRITCPEATEISQVDGTC